MEETGKEKRYSRGSGSKSDKEKGQTKEKRFSYGGGIAGSSVVCDDSYLSAFAYFLCVFAMLVYAGSM